ncbi:C12orf29 isoform 8 [Pan troglodytes]|uniref:C12orf29 isoform 8 n=1 Tax=Pan troglodytes TaxID=9598 RepID=A0A2J8MIL0_PANTR|nr:C12orf29 isoform 8 [Pan troglodytes]
MKRLGSVQRKIPCVFVTEVKEEPSSKREHQVSTFWGNPLISHLKFWQLKL